MFIYDQDRKTIIEYLLQGMFLFQVLQETPGYFSLGLEAQTRLVCTASPMM